jgi:putative ABC transport system permease protein
MEGQMFTVVGILEELEDGAEGSKDDQIIIPVTTAQRLTRNSAIRNFTFLASSPENVDAAMEAIKAFLTEAYGSENLFRVSNATQILNTLDSVTGTLMTVLGGIAAISLLVGGIGIMNIMLVSVTERTREIGIRKAIGAKRRNILTQFLIEALLVTGMGGIIGLLTGSAAIWAIGRAGLVPAVYSPLWMTVSFGISLAVGLIFGIFPAAKASRLNPITALRHE